MTAASAVRTTPRFSRRDVTVVHKPTLKRAVKGSIFGTVMEWYDVGVYGYLITTMGPVFLPEADRAVQTLFLFGTFAATFFIRPLGGWFFGWLGDRVGRQKVLAWTLILIAVSTAAIGLLPGYAQIGFWAAVLLLALKMLQGFSAGGEFSGVATFISEYAPDSRRGLYTSFMTFSSYMGFALGAAFVAVLQLTLGQEAMVEYGWRIPFLIAAPLGLIAVWFRTRIEESPTFTAALQLQKPEQLTPSRAIRPKGMVRRYGWVIIASIGLVAGENVVAYALTSYMPTYLTLSLDFNETEGTLLTLPILVLTALLCPVTGLLADRFGRRPVLWAASAATVVLAFPAFLLMGTGTVVGALIGIALLAVPAILYAGGIPAAVPSQFPTVMRYLGMGLAYNIGVAAFGGTSPLVMEALVTGTGNDLTPAFYLVAIGIVAAICIAFLKETAGSPLIGAGPSVSSEEEAQRVLADQDSDPKLITAREQYFANMAEVAQER